MSLRACDTYRIGKFYWFYVSTCLRPKYIKFCFENLRSGRKDKNGCRKSTFGLLVYLHWEKNAIEFIAFLLKAYVHHWFKSIYYRIGSICISFIGMFFWINNIHAFGRNAIDWIVFFPSVRHFYFVETEPSCSHELAIFLKYHMPLIILISRFLLILYKKVIFIKWLLFYNNSIDSSLVIYSYLKRKKKKLDNNIYKKSRNFNQG